MKRHSLLEEEAEPGGSPCQRTPAPAAWRADSSASKLERVGSRDDI